MPRQDLNRVGTFLAGLVLMLLAIFVMVPLPSDGSWEWLPFPFSPYLEFIIGIPLFMVGLVVAVDALKTQTPGAQKFPIVDEWIDEQGNGEREISELSKSLGQGEELLAIVAGRAEAESNRLAVTDKRVLVYAEKDPSSGLSISFDEIVRVRRKREPVLTHLGEIELFTKTGSVKFRKVGFEYAEKAIALINKLRRKDA